MKIEITAIEEADLPNYEVKIWSGGLSETRKAPLQGTFCVYLNIEGSKEQLFFQILKEPNGIPVVDHYYEGQKEYEILERSKSMIKNKKERTRNFNNFNNFLCELVIEEWRGISHFFPIQYEIYT